MRLCVHLSHLINIFASGHFQILSWVIYISILLLNKYTLFVRHQTLLMESLLIRRDERMTYIKLMNANYIWIIFLSDDRNTSFFFTSPFLSCNTFWETNTSLSYKIQFSSHANGLLEQNGQNCGMAVSKLQISQSKWTWRFKYFYRFYLYFFFQYFLKHKDHFVRNKQSFFHIINIILTYNTI
jgi:hypothetical protein